MSQRKGGRREGCWNHHNSSLSSSLSTFHLQRPREGKGEGERGGRNPNRKTRNLSCRRLRGVWNSPNTLLNAWRFFIPLSKLWQKSSHCYVARPLSKVGDGRHTAARKKKPQLASRLFFGHGRMGGGRRSGSGTGLGDGGMNFILPFLPFLPLPSFCLCSWIFVGGPSFPLIFPPLFKRSLTVTFGKLFVGFYLTAVAPQEGRGETTMTVSLGSLVSYLKMGNEDVSRILIKNSCTTTLTEKLAAHSEEEEKPATRNYLLCHPSKHERKKPSVAGTDQRKKEILGYMACVREQTPFQTSIPFLFVIQQARRQTDRYMGVHIDLARAPV